MCHSLAAASRHAGDVVDAATVDEEASVIAAQITSDT